MKIKLLVLAIILSGCSLKPEQKNIVSANKTFKVPPAGYGYGLGELNVIVIDNCEYLYGYVGGNGGYVLCHKGNCNNPIHVYNTLYEFKRKQLLAYC